MFTAPSYCPVVALLGALACLVLLCKSYASFIVNLHTYLLELIEVGKKGEKRKWAKKFFAFPSINIWGRWAHLGCVK